MIVCGFMTIAALQSFFSGLILSDMSIKNRRDFEFQRTLIEQNKPKQED